MPSKPRHDPLAAPLPGATTHTTNTTCYMCACRCGIRVTSLARTVAFVRSVKWLFLLAGFVVPAALLAFGITGAPTATMVAAFVMQFAGLIAERWHFFAQANHPQNLYYQAIA